MVSFMVPYIINFNHMTFKEKIDLQLSDNKMLSYEILSSLKNKWYYSGRLKQIGESVLFGLLMDTNEEEGEVTRVITFHEEEIGTLYEEDSSPYNQKKQNYLPRIKIIENGGH